MLFWFLFLLLFRFCLFIVFKSLFKSHWMWRTLTLLNINMLHVEHLSSFFTRILQWNRCIIFSVVFKIFIYYLRLFSLKRDVGGGGRGVNLTSPLKGKREPCFFVTFNIILKYIFPENCRLLENIKIYFVNINYFHQFFGNFDISLMQINYDVSIFLTFSLL